MCIYNNKTRLALISLVLVLVATNFCSALFGFGNNDPYKKIDKYLTEHYDHDNAVENMELANDYLSFLTKTGVVPNNELKLVDALDKFTALGVIKDETYRCTATSYKILLSNFQATKGRASKTATSRVDRVLYHYAYEHATHCRDVYPVKFEAKYSHIYDKLPIQRVEAFLDPIIKNYLKALVMSEFGRSKLVSDFYEDKKLKKLYDFFISGSGARAIGNQDDAALAYDAISKMVVADKQYDGEQDASEYATDVERLIKKYLDNPCEYYVQQLGPHLFVPAQFDAMIYEREQSFMVDKPELTEFYFAWARYRICSLFINNGHRMLTNNILKIAYE